MSELEKNMINDEELEKVNGGIGVVGRPTFEQCTQLLKEAGDIAFACSQSYWGGGRRSDLHDHINWAEKASDNTTRFTNVCKAKEDMGTCPDDVKYCKLSPENYNFIKSNLDIVYNATKTYNPRILA